VGYAFHRLGHLTDAEDVAQEVFIRAYAERVQRSAVTNVGAYLYRMAANLCTDFMRRCKHPTVSLKEAQIEEIPTYQPDGSQVALAAEEQRGIEAVLSRIPGQQAEVVREFFEALIAKDYAKAGRLYEGIPAAKLEQGFAGLTVVRILSIGKPTPHPIPGVGGLRVPCQIEVEKDGVRSTQTHEPGVRPVYSQPDHWTIHGGI